MFNPAWGIQANLREQGIQFPATAVIRSALDRYQTHYRRPVAAYYCLDGSGSMADNGGWDGVEDAAHQIFDQEKAAANFLQTHPQDRTTVAIFNTGIAHRRPGIGQIGAGLVNPPLACFEKAGAALAATLARTTPG